MYSTIVVTAMQATCWQTIRPGTATMPLTVPPGWKPFDGNIQVNRYDAEACGTMEENGSLVQFIFNQDREVIAEQNSFGITRYIRSSG